jgi:hypothetical protein
VIAAPDCLSRRPGWQEFGCRDCCFRLMRAFRRPARRGSHGTNSHSPLSQRLLWAASATTLASPGTSGSTQSAPPLVPGRLAQSLSPALEALLLSVGGESARISRGCRGSIPGRSRSPRRSVSPAPSAVSITRPASATPARPDRGSDRSRPPPRHLRAPRAAATPPAGPRPHRAGPFTLAPPERSRRAAFVFCIATGVSSPGPPPRSLAPSPPGSAAPAHGGQTCCPSSRPHTERRTEPRTTRHGRTSNRNLTRTDFPIRPA